MGWIHYSYDADRRDEARGVITGVIFGRHALSLTRKSHDQLSCATNWL